MDRGERYKLEKQFDNLMSHLSLFFLLKYKLHPEPSSFNFFFSYGMAVLLIHDYRQKAARLSNIFHRIILHWHMSLSAIFILVDYFPAA